MPEWPPMALSCIAANDTMLQIRLMTNPDSLIITQQTIPIGKLGHRGRINNQLSNDLLGVRIRLIRSSHIL